MCFTFDFVFPASLNDEPEQIRPERQILPMFGKR